MLVKMYDSSYTHSMVYESQRDFFLVVDKHVT